MEVQYKMFYKSISKPGKGVEKRDPNEPRIKTYFDILPRKIWSLIKLNFLYMLAAIPFFIVTWFVAGVVSIPVVEMANSTLVGISASGMDMLLRIVLSYLFMSFLGQGPVTAGFVYIVREYTEERPVWLTSDFFGRCKKNFKQSFLLWIVDLLVFYLFAIAFMFYGNTGNWILQGLLLVVGAIYVMMHIYIHQMMITFDLSFKNILKNSLLLVVSKAPANLLILLVCIIIYAIIPTIIILSVRNFTLVFFILMLEIFIVSPILNFSINFYINPILKNSVGTVDD